MKLFLDSTNVEEIRELFAFGIVDGITTNPTLMAKNGLDNVEFCFQISDVLASNDMISVSLEVISQNCNDMIQEVVDFFVSLLDGDASSRLFNMLLARKVGDELVNDNEDDIIVPKVTIKLPITFEGLKACKILSVDGIYMPGISHGFEAKKTIMPVNMTLCFSAQQALLAAKAGAAYVSPFVGRLDDVGQSGMDLIRDIRTVFDNYYFDTEILVASVRNMEHVKEAAKIGADVVTLPPKILREMVLHELTDKGLEKFLDDWENRK